MPGINPIVARSIQARGNLQQPQDTLQKEQLKAQVAQQAAWSNATAQPAFSVTPAPSGGGGSFWSQVGGDGKVDINRIMQTIRNRESGGNYGAKNPYSSASGAYQFIDSTWGGYGGYKHAWQAPQAVQDAKAKANIMAILAKYGNALESVPAAWYTGSYKGKGNLNYNPGGPGNPLTVQAYVDKWLSDYYGK